MNELELRREEKITASELAAVFGQFLEILERELEPRTYFALVPLLRRATAIPVLPQALQEPELEGEEEPQTAPHTPGQRA